MKRKYHVRLSVLNEGKWVLFRLGWFGEQHVGSGASVQECVQQIHRLEHPLYYDATGRRVN